MTGSAVQAVTARRMACFLLTRAMSKRHELDMSSYDRLFPNQDTMPTGGFGNLIALPLQHEPRSRGNTVFVDETFRPYPDQWLYLADIERTSAIGAERISADAQRSGQGSGCGLSNWTRTPQPPLGAFPLLGGPRRWYRQSTNPYRNPYTPLSRSACS